ncbi:Disease resistance protein [Nymphaea thermarum]|nr:Disease resistance protein [Nymphaea thermarum]
METVIGVLAEASISNLLGTITNLLKEKVDLIRNAKDELEQLQGKLEHLQKALKDADLMPFFSNERNRDMEGELKDVFYDAQDIIEEYRTIIELSKREKGSMTLWNKVRKTWILLCSCFKERVSAPYHLGKEIKKINQRLNKILEQPRKENGQRPIGVEDESPRETTHHIGAQPPIGRENDKRVIVEKLLSNGSGQSSMTEKRDVSIISIVGEGGIGKTTLAKMVFGEVEQQFGECRWWVCVSERPNRKDLLRKILKEACKGSTAGLDCITSLSDLCTQIESELSKKRFLLVLDDIWELDWWQGEVESTLMKGVMGSKILITSRNIDVSKGIGALYMHRLPILPEEESWNLFLNKALRTENDLASHNLQDVAKKIVKKCGGLPLVVQTVGSLMRTKRMEKAEWKVVADSVIWEWKMSASSSSSQYGSILPGLILSYDDLPPYLRSCFVYCSIFPKDHKIKREGLIMQWVAHGLIEEKKNVGVEVTTNQYIEDLISRCLIEETHDRFYLGTYVKLHDILHDLASYIGGKEYSHASATEHTRHLSLLGLDDAKAAMQSNASRAANKVRTLLLSEYLSLVEFTNFKWLRVLSLRGCQMDKLPNSIESLLLLKYLDLRESYVRRLPRSIGKLFNLQTLDLSYSKIEELPEEMGELCNLRYLGLERTQSLQFMAEGLGKLNNLQTLHRFLVCDDRGDSRGCNIRELKDLNKLKGELLIEGLGERWVKVIDAMKAQLKKKHELIRVKFDFKVGEDDNVDSASEQRGLLEALEPPHGIERLTICHYEGDRPAWYLDTNYEELRKLQLRRCRFLATVIGIKSLKKLEVNECNGLKTLTNMPTLESLKVRECGSLEQVAEMPALRSLQIYTCNMVKTLANMPALESLQMSTCGSLEQVAEMPALRSLTVYQCIMLKTLASMAALERLTVDECGRLEQVAEMPTLRSLEVGCGGMGGCKRLKTLTHMPALQSLDVRECGSLEQVAEMPALRSLRVEGCNMLKTLANTLALESLEVRYCGRLEQVDELPALRSLSVYKCNMLKAFANMPTLELLKVRDCGSLEQVAEMPALRSLEVGGSTMMKTLDSIPALETLKVKDCGSLEEIAEMPALRSLKVYKCNMLKTLANMPALESLEVGCCDSLKQVREMPALRSLEVYGCNRLKTLAHMPALQSLNVSFCGRLEQVAHDQMPALESLVVTYCCSLKQLPHDMPALKKLRLSDLNTRKHIPSLEELRMGDPSMIDELVGHDGQATQLQDLAVWDCPNARLEWKLLRHLPNLIELVLDREALELIGVPLEVSTYLPSLRSLTLMDNNTGDLKWGKVPDWVWALSQLEDLILYGFSEYISLGGHWQCLSKLRYLELHDFPNLQSLVDVNNITPQQNETCPTDAKQQSECLLKLERLRISRCPALDLPQELRDRLGGWLIERR